jgi:hypothetical protein
MKQKVTNDLLNRIQFEATEGNILRRIPRYGERYFLMGNDEMCRFCKLFN